MCILFCLMEWGSIFCTSITIFERARRTVSEFGKSANAVLICWSTSTILLKITNSFFCGGWKKTLYYWIELLIWRNLHEPTEMMLVRTDASSAGL